MPEIMKGKDTISGSLAECYVTIDGDRYNFMQAINFEARFEKNKAEVPILGKTGKGNKANGWSGSGSMTCHYNQSVMRKLAEKYKNEAIDTYFTMEITNEDKTSATGKQTTILMGCNFDSMLLAKFDTDADYLDEDFDFTFEDFELKKAFTELAGFRM